MRIILADAYITYSPEEAHATPLGGTETSFIHMAEALAARGHEVMVRLRAPAVEHHRGVEYSSWDKRAGRDADAVVVRSPGLLRGWTGRAAVRAWWCHRAMDRESIEDALRLRAYPIVCSRWQAEQLLMHRWPLGFDVVPLGCRFIGRPAPGVRREPFTALWASAADRGLEPLLADWRRARRNLPGESKLWIAGGAHVYREHGRSLEPLEKRLREDTRHDRGVSWLGALDPGAIWTVLHQAGFMPYRAAIPESFCLIALESQAAGCLPIVTPLGALRERVVHGKTGWVEEPSAFEGRMLAYAAAADEPSTEALRASARAAAGKLTWDASARRFEEAIEKARRAAAPER